jgi:hypothetical protein
MNKKYTLNGFLSGASLALKVLGQFRANGANALLAGRGARAAACRLKQRD